MSTTSRNISSQTFNEIQEFEPQVGVEFEFVVHGLLLTSIGIAGLFANIICLIILCQPSLRRGQGSVNVILVNFIEIIADHLFKVNNNNVNKKILLFQTDFL